MTTNHFGPHNFEAPHADNRPRSCQIAGCPVVREGRRIYEATKHHFAHAEAQSFALGRKADSRTARRFGDWVQAVQTAYPETLETHWADFCQARHEEANDI